MAPRTVAGESTANTATSVWEYLHEELLNNGDIEKFLGELARVSARNFSAPGSEVLCGIFLLRGRKGATIAGSSAAARALSQIELKSGNGPATAAASDQATGHIPDVEEDVRWPEYSEAALGQGIRSVLSIPFQLAEGTSASMVLYSSRSGRFESVLQAAEDFVRQTSLALRLAVRFAQYSDTAANLRAALESRTVIDMAVGIIMAQNRCSQQEAFELLRTASSTRNTKLHQVAAGIVNALGQGPAETHYDG